MKNEILKMRDKKILVGSPVYQKPRILEAFLRSLKKLNYDGVSLDYMFVDDNADEESKKYWLTFKEKDPRLLLCRVQKKPHMYATESRIIGTIV